MFTEVENISHNAPFTRLGISDHCDRGYLNVKHGLKLAQTSTEIVYVPSLTEGQIGRWLALKSQCRPPT